MRERVYELLKEIPAGKVATYGLLGEKLGNRKLARAIGDILHYNPDPDNYPCFKVVNSQGFLAEHFAYGGKVGQKERLEKDGIVVNEDFRVDLKTYLWR